MEGETPPAAETNPGQGIIQRTGELVKSSWERFMGTEMMSPITGAKTRAELYGEAAVSPGATLLSPVVLWFREFLGTALRVEEELSPLPRARMYTEGIGRSIVHGLLAIVDVPVTEAAQVYRPLAARLRDMFDKSQGLKDTIDKLQGGGPTLTLDGPTKT